MSVASLARKTVAKHSANRFIPTDLHRQAKAAFWSHFFSKGETPPLELDGAVGAHYSGYTEVLEFWAIPGFSEWFSNGEEFRQRVEYVSSLALDVIEAVLRDREARHGDKLQAARMALEIASKYPKAAAKEQFADEKIAEMTSKQLEEYIAQKMRVLGVGEPGREDLA
jgi:hypothetical protein